MGAIVPLLLALLILQIHRGQPIPTSAFPLSAMLGALVLWAGLTEVTARLAARGGRLWLKRWELGAQGACLGVFLWLCRGQGWATWAPGWSVALAPWLLMQVCLWSSQVPALRMVSRTAWSRAGIILHHLRFELAPMLLVLPVIDLSEWIGRRYGMITWFEGGDGLLVSLLGGWLLVFGLMCVLPPLLALLWGVRRLPAIPLADQLSTDCTRSGLPRIALRQWSSPGGSVHNAVAIGLLPGLRWVLISDDLLRDLPPDQVRAVVGHEVGHHRHRHLLTYLWFALSCMLAKWWALGLLLGTVDATGQPLSIGFGFDGGDHVGLLFGIPGIEQLPSDVVLGVALTIAVLLCWRVLFGFVSRACEREADLAGAEVAGPAAMAAALQTVARLSGTPDDAPSWRHHPIRERVRFLDAVARNPGLASLHRRFVRDMRLAIIATLVLLAAMATSLWLDPLREAVQNPDPVGAIAAWADKDPSLASSLQAADGGDTGPLIAWLGRVPAVDRQRLAVLHGNLVQRSGGVAANGRILPPDDRSPWRLRHRFAALSAVPMEDLRGIGLDIDNIYAYALVAGTAHPSPQDIEQARAVLPRLEAAVAKMPSHGLLDTIASVRYATRDWDGARRGWEDALAQLAKDGVISASDRAASEALYKRRLADAQFNLAVAAGSKPGPLKPLYLTFSE